MNPNKALLIALLNACNIFCADELFHYSLRGLSIWVIFDDKAFTNEMFVWKAGNYTQLYNIFLDALKTSTFWNPVTIAFCNL